MMFLAFFDRRLPALCGANAGARRGVGVEPGGGERARQDELLHWAGAAR
jgi:hypothetical protein